MRIVVTRMHSGVRRMVRKRGARSSSLVLDVVLDTRSMIKSRKAFDPTMMNGEENRDGVEIIVCAEARA